MIRVLLAAVMLSACSESDRAPASRGVGAPLDPVVEPAKAPNLSPMRAERNALKGYMAPIFPTSITETRQAEAAAQGRDMERELISALGGASGCGSLGSTEPHTLSIRATITSPGRVTSASVSGAIPPSTRECLVDRLEQHVFAGPVPGAPRSFSARVQVTGSGQTTEERVAVEPPPASLTRDQQHIAGPNGVTISMTPSVSITMAPGAQDIAGPSGETIAGAQGQMISGPSGVTIGQ